MCDVDVCYSLFVLCCLLSFVVYRLLFCCVVRCSVVLFVVCGAFVACCRVLGVCCVSLLIIRCFGVCLFCVVVHYLLRVGVVAGWCFLLVLFVAVI